MKVYWILVLSMGCVCASAFASEPGCYRTAEAAAAQAGVRGVDGFRLEGRQRDVFSGAVWATVRSCAHPERPGLLVLAAGDAGRPGLAPRSEPVATILTMLRAGTKVTLLAKDDVVQIEMQGVAQGSGSVGDRVRVRLLALNAEGAERFVDGIVRGSDVVEMVTP